MGDEASETLRIERAVYGGSGLARSASGKAVFVPFTLPGELVELERRQLDPNQPQAAAPQPAALQPAALQPAPMAHEAGGPGTPHPSAGAPATNGEAQPIRLLNGPDPMDTMDTPDSLHSRDALEAVNIVEASPERTVPACPHFGPCGGCQYQMATYPEQLRMKSAILAETLQRAEVTGVPDLALHSAEPWGYRNRIRLRIERAEQIEGVGSAAPAQHPQRPFRFGYNRRGSQQFLPITTCPIAAPLLWSTAVALLKAATGNDPLSAWLEAAAEVELFCAADQTRVQVTLLCSRRPPSAASFVRAMSALQLPHLAGAAALQVDPRTGRPGRTLATTGAAGLNYHVAFAGLRAVELAERPSVPPAEPSLPPFAEALDEASYWISRGGFFQVNRFLIPTLVNLVCTRGSRPRTGSLAWDLFAGIGLFSQVLARSFAQITAVEAHLGAAADLRAALARLSPASQALQSTTLDFLRAAVLQRDRPELVVLDPPRAGAGVEACTLLARLAPREIVYVSCDPTTLARDLYTLQSAYTIAEMHLVDLFPQTFHLETVAVLQRR